MKVSFSPDIVHGGWLGSKHRIISYLMHSDLGLIPALTNMISLIWFHWHVLISIDMCHYLSWRICPKSTCLFVCWRICSKSTCLSVCWRICSKSTSLSVCWRICSKSTCLSVCWRICSKSTCLSVCWRICSKSTCLSVCWRICSKPTSLSVCWRICSKPTSLSVCCYALACETDLREEKKNLYRARSETHKRLKFLIGRNRTKSTFCPTSSK